MIQSFLKDNIGPPEPNMCAYEETNDNGNPPAPLLNQP